MCMWMSEERKNIVVSHKKGWYAVGDIVTVQTNFKKTSSKSFPKNSSFKPKDGGMKCFQGLFRHIVVYIRNIEVWFYYSLLYRTYNGSNHVNPPPLIARNLLVTLPFIIFPVNQ